MDRQQQILQGMAMSLADPEEGDPPPEAFAPAAQRLPGYVEHAEGVPQTGALTAEVIVVEHESLIKGVEEMSKQLLDFEDFCKQKLVQVHSARIEVDGLVKLIRDEAKAAFEKVQERSLLLEKLKQTCQGIRQEFSGT